MKWIKWNTAALIAGITLIVFAVSIGAAAAATVASNVALFQPVEVTVGTLNYTLGPASNLTNDVVDGTAYRVTFTSDLGTLMVDLGGAYDLESLHLDFVTATGAKLQGYAPSEFGFQFSEQIGTIYTVGSTKPYTTELTDWNGVQYITISDEGANPGKMVVRELRAYAQVDTYPGFIAGVTATATDTYPGVADVKAMSLCNNGGMTDQRGPVGDPNGMSIPSGPFWQPASDVTNAAVTFDLGGRYALSQMLIWNLNQLNWDVRGIQHALIEYSTDGETYTALPDANGGEDGNYTIPIVSLDEQLQYTLNPYSLAIDMTGITAKYVRIEGLDSWGGTNIGLSEVRFYGDIVATQIPGDANNDTFVNEADAKILATYWGATAKPNPDLSWWEMGDFNGDEAIGARDAAILAAQWTGSPGESSPATAVPEPLAGWLLLSLMLAVCGLRRNRTNR